MLLLVLLTTSFSRNISLVEVAISNKFRTIEKNNKKERVFCIIPEYSFELRTGTFS